MADSRDPGPVGRPGSFAAPTRGRSDALTLTTFLTDAADLHFAVVRAGHAPLAAADIKTAAALRGSEDTSQDRGGQGAATAGRVDALAAAIKAETVTVERAQKLETVVDALRPNTSYDVYFVAEVIGSNGVFGQVQSALALRTHPDPPVIQEVLVSPANATAEAVDIRITLSASGKVFIALRPNCEHSTPLTQEELSTSRSLDVSQQPIFTAHDMVDNNLTFNKSVIGLTPSTTYDIFLVSEASGGGDVRSQIKHIEKAVRTHSLPPEIRKVGALPKNGSSFELDVSYRLDFHPEDLLRITDESLPLFNVNIYYEASALVNGKNTSATATAATSKVGKKSHSAHSEKTAVTDKDFVSAEVNGSIVFGNFTSLDQLRTKIAETQHITIGGLRDGTEYQVTLIAETAKSNGLFGLRKLSFPVYTHQVAPAIIHSMVEPTIGTVHELTVRVNMSGHGNIHYIVAKGHIPVAHNDLLRMTSFDQLFEMVEERNRASEPTLVSYVGLEDVPRVMKNGSERHRTGNYSRTFQIRGLQDSTQYSVIIIPETFGSFGVFGLPYHKILDSITYENASSVSLRGLTPVTGSTSSIEAHVWMSKPADVLLYCIDVKQNDSTSMSRGEQCAEANRSTFEYVHGQPNEFRFPIENLVQGLEYAVSVYSESSLRNEVFSSRSSSLSTQTYEHPPRIQSVYSVPVNGSTAMIKTDATMDRQCLLHYVILPAFDQYNQTEQFESELANSSKAMLEYTSKDVASQFGRQSRMSLASSGRLFVSVDQTIIETAGLAANTTYKIYMITETSRDGSSSGVVSNFTISNVTTHASAPTIVKAIAAPVAGTIDSIVVAMNLSHPGIVHYFLSDADFADPAVIRVPDAKSAASLGYTPHTIRGEFSIEKNDIYLEIINGTNDTGPTDPPMFVKNVTITGLKSGALYHVSLTTETFDSQGVFGEFPPPILVSSHPPAPQISPEMLEVGPTAGSSTSIDISLRLERFGDVHYALFFRGLNHDRSDSVFAAERAHAEIERQQRRAEMKAEMIAAGTFNASNFTDDAPNLWPPLSSSFDLSSLNPSLLKAARFDDLGAGVWENGTISVSREDVLKGKLTRKTIEKLPQNAVFDLCLVSETEGNSEVFDWNSSDTDCHRVTTHADYTNQSVLFDEVQVVPTPGRTDSIEVRLNISKLLTAPTETFAVNGSVTTEGFATSTGRIPRLILLNGKDGRREFNYNSFSSSRDTHGVNSAFVSATPGQGGVIATGVIDTFVGENETFLTVARKIDGLKSNTPYLFYFAYETARSGGVFTRINPHKHRPNDSRLETNGIEVETYEAPPVLSRIEASPTHGNATSLTVKFDISCEACDRAIVHILAYPEICSTPSTDFFLPKGHFDEIISNTNDQVTEEEMCSKPLAKRRVKIPMPERQHQRKDIEEEIGGNMPPNTSYVILLATETVNSSGVISDYFQARRVKTHVLPPKFRSLQLLPRKASTTELLLQFQLDGPGEVHYMLGQSDNSEFNATSALNITSKGGGRSDRRGRSHHQHYDEPNYHDYDRDVVRMRRSFKVDPGGVDSLHTEVLDYLQPGTAYDAYVIVEAAGENGVYSSIKHFRDVSTFSNAPILLAHAANPTPAATNSLSVGFRIDGPGTIHFSVVSVAFWGPTRRVAPSSDKYGNRLAMVEQLVVRDYMVIDESSMVFAGPGSRDSGWHEKRLPVPHAAANYTVHVVTETTSSDGVYGIVATHHNVRSHALPPLVLRVSVSPTDARMDSLTVSVRLSDPGHVHYVALAHGSVFVPNDESEFLHHGVVAANESTCVDVTDIDCSYAVTFDVEELAEGTSHDIYVRAETLDSYGVFGEWQTVAATARTHGLPPAILHELDCTVSPSCEALGRYTVSADIFLLRSMFIDRSI